MSLETEKNRKQAASFYKTMSSRRSCRDFVKSEVDLEIIKTCILTASTAPSGANKQPWFFSIVLDAKLKSQIRIEAEKEEYEFYNSRAPDYFINDLKPLATNWQKPHLEAAGALIVIFQKNFELKNEVQTKNYYVKESVGIATGFLITALHQAGYQLLTHTPSPMTFLNKILDRPSTEKPFLILTVGFENKNAKKLNLKKKCFAEIGEIL